MAHATDTKTRQLRSRLCGAVALGVASGVLTLIDPAKLKPGTRAMLYVSTGVGSGLTAWFGSAREEFLKSKKALRGVLTLGLTALGVASTKFGFVLDAKTHHALLRRGFANPRPIMAVGSGILTAATFLLDRPSEGTSLLPLVGDSEDELPIRGLSDPVRELLAGMLAHTNEFGAEILREQLGSVREQYWGDPAEFGFQLDLVVAPGGTRTVPRDYTFPVHANFTTDDGEPVRVSLVVRDGQLGALVLDLDHEAMEPADEASADPLDALTRWPLRSEVSYSLES